MAHLLRPSFTSKVCLFFVFFVCLHSALVEIVSCPVFKDVSGARHLRWLARSSDAARLERAIRRDQRRVGSAARRRLCCCCRRRRRRRRRRRDSPVRRSDVERRRATTRRRDRARCRWRRRDSAALQNVAGRRFAVDIDGGDRDNIDGSVKGSSHRTHGAPRSINARLSRSQFVHNDDEQRFLLIVSLSTLVGYACAISSCMRAFFCLRVPFRGHKPRLLCRLGDAATSAFVVDTSPDATPVRRLRSVVCAFFQRASLRTEVE